MFVTNTKCGKGMFIEVDANFPNAMPMFMRAVKVNSAVWYICIPYEIDIELP